MMLAAGIAISLALSVGPAAARPAPAKKPAPPSICSREIGERPWRDLLNECREVATAGGQCGPDRSCEALRSEIRRGCEEAGQDAPAFCETHVDLDDDEDE